MKIVVLGGSPKGETSVTMQYVRWIVKSFPEHEFDVRQVAQGITALEKSDERLAEVIGSVEEAEAVIWAFPLYVYTVCSQYKRFIELIHERKMEGAFSGKYAASLSTSIHFYDHTAHNYIAEVSEDLGMNFTGSFSPKMDDILQPECRRQLELFAGELIDAASRRLPLPRRSSPLPAYVPASPRSLPVGDARVATGKRVAVIVDYPEGNAGAMARRFASKLQGDVDLIELPSIDIKGGCLGCLRCGRNNRCAWEGKDGFIETYRTRIKTADIIVYAGTVRDRALSARWKTYLDRSFFNTHQRSLQGKQFVFLVAGPLSAMTNLRETLSAYVEWQGSNIVDFVSDEVPDSPSLEAIIDATAARAVAAAEAAAFKPVTFRGVAGMKVFRDDVYGGLRIVFKGDHREYRRTGVYDFPTRKIFVRLAVWLGYWITSIPFIYRGMMKDFPKRMIRSYQPLFKK
jgi:multimeric flavodoxin WrbA